MRCFAVKLVVPAIAAKRSLPARVVIHGGVSEVIRPSQPTIGRVGSCNSRHQVTSARSPNVHTIAIPEPFSGSAKVWAMTGTSTPNTGVITLVPKSGW